MLATVWQYLCRRGCTIRTILYIKRRMGSAYLLCREQSMLTKITDGFTRDPNQASVGRRTVGDAQNLTI